VSHLTTPPVRKWFDASAFALEIGSAVFTKDRIASKDFTGVKVELMIANG
jgi:hypothetical protein